MRDERQNHALPRAPNEGAPEAGLRVVPTPLERLRASEVRCPTERCGKLIANQLHGTITLQCPRCKKRVTITRD